MNILFFLFHSENGYVQYVYMYYSVLDFIPLANIEKYDLNIQYRTLKANITQFSNGNQ